MCNVRPFSQYLLITRLQLYAVFLQIPGVNEMHVWNSFGEWTEKKNRLTKTASEKLHARAAELPFW